VRQGALLSAVALAAACSTETPQSCPGEVVGVFAFEGTLATTLAEGLDPQPLLPDCAPVLPFPATLPKFGGTLAADPGGSGGALCRPLGPHLLGTHAGQRFVVATSSGGAVLGACGPTCAATSRLVIAGDVLPDLESPQEFQGALVEQLTVSEGSCDACVLPCAARYRLTGTVEPP
jgi:hypothetical protein